MAVLALIALAVPRLITAAPLDLLDEPSLKRNPTEDAGENFPGSAFFFSQGMFDHLPTSSPKSPHVLTLEAAQAAPVGALRGLTALDSYRALNCLTSAIYYEAGNEPDEGQRAVAQVVINRVRSPLWPHSVCSVVYQGSERTDMRCQFTFSCDGSMMRPTDGAGWARSRRVAEQALAGRVYAPVGLATFYHTLAVRPGWAATMRPVAVVGAHIFYRLPGFQGMRAALYTPYSGRELQAGPSVRAWTRPAPFKAIDQMPQSSEFSPLAKLLPSPPGPTDAEGLPQSEIRPEFRNSGRPRI